MHTQGAGMRNHRWLTLALLAASWCVRVDAAGVPATRAAEPAAQASQEQPIAEVASATTAESLAPAPEKLLQWEFSYKGYRIKAEGTVLTRAEPRPDGTYEIVSVTGKRNKREILRLQPAGELMTVYGLLFADNRLWVQSPYLTQSGFTFRMDRGPFSTCVTRAPTRVAETLRRRATDRGITSTTFEARNGRSSSRSSGSIRWWSPSCPRPRRNRRRSCRHVSARAERFIRRRLLRTRRHRIQLGRPRHGSRGDDLRTCRSTEE